MERKRISILYSESDDDVFVYYVDEYKIENGFVSFDYKGKHYMLNLNNVFKIEEVKGE